MSKHPFILQNISKEIFESMNVVIKRIIDSDINNYVCIDNAQMYYHGKGWINTHGFKDGEETQLKEITGYAEISYEEIVWFNTTALNEFITSIANSLSGQAIKDIFRVVNEACVESGNIVVDEKDKDFKDKFIELLEKVELSVDEHGNINMPSIYVGEGLHEEIRHEMENPDEEYTAKVEEIKRIKTVQAKQKERDRLLKYKGVVA